jgi:hypothetical protein
MMQNEQILQKFFHPVETYMIENMDFFHEDYNTPVIEMIENSNESAEQIESIIGQLARRFTKKNSSYQVDQMFKRVGTNLLARYDTKLESIKQ